MSADGVKQPLDLLRMSVGKGIVVQMRHERELAGTLVGFDIHVNMILSRVTEVRTFVNVGSPLHLLFFIPSPTKQTDHPPPGWRYNQPET